MQKTNRWPDYVSAWSVSPGHTYPPPPARLDEETKATQLKKQNRSTSESLLYFKAGINPLMADRDIVLCYYTHNKTGRGLAHVKTTEWKLDAHETDQDAVHHPCHHYQIGYFQNYCIYHDKTNTATYCMF